MAYSHVAHDCELSNHVVMANHATLAGHAVVQDHVVFGGMVAVGSFVRIGESAMLAAGSMIERDVPPFCLVAGDRAKLRAINRVGLTRRGIEPEVKRQIKDLFRALKDPGQSLAGIVDRFSKEESLAPAPLRMLEFIRQGSRGIVR
jgi:UDP-N-acetylglucosamine acyltransferase